MYTLQNKSCTSIWNEGSYKEVLKDAENFRMEQTKKMKVIVQDFPCDLNLGSQCRYESFERYCQKTELEWSSSRILFSAFAPANLLLAESFNFKNWFINIESRVSDPFSDCTIFYSFLSHCQHNFVIYRPCAHSWQLTSQRKSYPCIFPVM